MTGEQKPGAADGVTQQKYRESCGIGTTGTAGQAESQCSEVGTEREVKMHTDKLKTDVLYLLIQTSTPLNLNRN